jgi:hypothetical protein
MEIVGMRLTNPLATLMEADAAAIRLLLNRSYIVEVWHRDRMIACIQMARKDKRPDFD